MKAQTELVQSMDLVTGELRNEWVVRLWTNGQEVGSYLFQLRFYTKAEAINCMASLRAGLKNEGIR